MIELPKKEGIMSTIEQRVAAGAAFLDSVVPGWEGRINLETLELASGYECICGQVWSQEGFDHATNGFAYFEGTLAAQGAAWLQTTGETAFYVSTQLGFDVDERSTEWAEWDDLQDAWTSLIKTRHDAGTLSGMEN